MTRLADGITQIQAPALALANGQESEWEIVIDVLEGGDAGQTQVKTRASDGQLRVRTLSEIAGISNGSPPEGTLAVKELSARLAERRDIEDLLVHATPRAREQVAVRGWLVGLLVQGRPMEIPGASTLSWLPPFSGETSAVTPEKAIALLHDYAARGTGDSIQSRLIRVSERSLYRWWKGYEKDGLRALVHGSLGNSRLERSAQAPVIKEFITGVASRTAQNEAKITQRRFAELCLLEAIAAGLATLPGSTKDPDALEAHRLVRHFASQAHRHWQLSKSLSQRHSRELSRKSSSPSIYRDQVPFTEIQIDATPLDAYALDEYGQQAPQVQMLFATDVASGSFVDALLLPCAPTARDVTDFLVEMILRMTEQRDAHLLAPDRLRTVALGELVTDRGSNMIAEEVTSSLAVLGIDVKSAGAGRGDQKGLVEAVQGKANDFARLIFGAHGATQREGPKFNPKDRYLTVDQWQALIRAWGHEVYNATPKDRLRPPGFKAAITPQMYVDAFRLVIRPPDRPFPVDALKGQLTHRSGVLTSQGIEFGGYQFVWPRGIVKPHLAEHTRTATGHSVTVYGPHRFPQYVIVDAIDALTGPITLILLRSDTYAHETHSDVLALVAEGLDLEAMVHEAKASATSADERRIALAHAARSSATKPTAPARRGRTASSKTKNEATSSVELDFGDQYQPTSWLDETELDAKAAKYLATITKEQSP